MSLEQLLRPKSVALVGATEKTMAFGNFLAQALLRSNPQQEIFFVNTKSESIFGKTTYKTIADLPVIPEMIILATSKDTVAQLLTQAGEMGTKAAIVIAAGYDEGDVDKAAADEIGKIVKKYDLKVLGPNTVGFVNNIDKFLPWATAGYMAYDLDNMKTGVAAFAQSGTSATNVVTSHLNSSYVFSMGNCTWLTMEELLEYVIEEDKVDVIGIYLEGVRDPKRFIKVLARAQELGKPVVIHAAGTSNLGAQAASSHTGNMASSRTVYEAIFKKYNVIMVDTQDEWICAMDVLSIWKDRLPKRFNIAGFNASGGETTCLADMCDRFGLTLPVFTQSTVDKLKEISPGFATVKNPIDITGGSVNVTDKDFLAIIGDDPNVDLILCSVHAFPAGVGRYLDFARNMGLSEDSYQDYFLKEFVAYSKNGKANLAIAPLLENTRDKRVRKILAECGIPILVNSDLGYSVLAKIVQYSKNRDQDRARINAIPDKVHDSKKTIVLTELDSKQALSEYRLPMPKQAVAETKEKLNSILDGFKFPVALKISSPDILHKTDAGGVKLNVQTKKDALDAFNEIMANCAKYNPKAKLDAILVQEMARPGTEIIIGINNDEKFGPMLMIGMGGIFVEIFKDVALYPCPMSKNEALTMIKSLKSYKLFEGYRGSKPLDVDALTEVMVRISEFAARNKDFVKELDINPVFLYPKGEGISIVDALLIKFSD